MLLSSKDYKGILEIIHTIHSIPDWTEMLKCFCERLQKLIPISGAIFFPVDSGTRNFQSEGTFRFRYSSDPLLKLYLDHYVKLDPLVVSGWIYQKNKAARYSDFVSHSHLQNSEFGQDFLSPASFFHCLGAALSSQGDTVMAFGIHRQRHDRDFSDREKEIVNILAPHLSSAFHNIGLIDTIALAEGIGMIVIGAEGHPSYINEEARRALDGRPVERIPDPGCSTAPAFFRSEKGVYRVRTTFFGERGKKIILLEPLPSENYVKSRINAFGLTKREMEVVVLVIRGLSNREIAERLFVTEATIKEHLHDVFDKAHVYSRSELTAKVLGIG